MSILMKKQLAWPFLLFVLMLIRPAESHLQSRAEPSEEADRDAPNIVIIIGDDLKGGALGIDGDPRMATPNLDRLASEGVRFDRAYCNSPLCTPSRQSFITGRLPHAAGVTLLKTPLPRGTPTLGTWLGSHGYDTGAIGKMHFNSPLHHGFTERIDHPDWMAWLKKEHPEEIKNIRPFRPFHDPARIWLNADVRSCGYHEAVMDGTFFAERTGGFFERHKERPFGLVVGFYQPHSPFLFPSDARRVFKPEEFSAPSFSEEDLRNQPLVFKGLTEADTKGISASYYSSLAYHDRSVGTVLDNLEKAGLADRTIVVYLGDNGYMLGQHARFEKHTLYENCVRIPLLIRWPGHITPGGRVSGMVELVDVLPTILDLAGLPRPDGLHGTSFADALAAGDLGAIGRKVVVSEYQENQEAMARSDRYKLIVGTGRLARDDGYVNADPTPGPYQRLYDMQDDPDENIDLSDKPEMLAVRQELLNALHDRLTTTQPEGGTVPSGLSTLEAVYWCLVARDAPKLKPE
jgi:choline-sulfatase